MVILVISGNVVVLQTLIMGGALNRQVTVYFLYIFIYVVHMKMRMKLFSFL